MPTTTQVFARVDALQQDLDRLASLGDLPADWNSYGSAAITPDSLAVARRILFSVALNETFGSYDRVRPYAIAPLAHGGIHLEWRNLGDELTVEINPDGSSGILAIQVKNETETSYDEDGTTLYTILTWLDRILAGR